MTIGDLTASTAAQTGALNFLTADASGTLGRGVAVSSLATSAQVAALQATQTTQGGQISSLFDLNDLNRRDIRKANEGVAMALAMESPMLPNGTSFAVSGGVGYFENRTAGTAAFTARVGQNAAVSGGVGVGFDSGEVGARGGFQIAW